MAFYGQIYKLDKSENFEDFVKSLELPAENAEQLINGDSSQKIEQDGDEYVITTFFGSAESVMRFKSGVEFDEAIGPITAKNTVTVDDNKVVQVQKFDDENAITYTREYSPSELVVTITSTFWSGTAKQFYVAEN